MSYTSHNPYSRKSKALLISSIIIATSLLAAVPPFIPRATAAESVVATISVSSGPEGVAVNPNTNRVYVANQNSNTVSVIDGSTKGVGATIPVGTSPSGVAVNLGTNRVYVANS